MYQYKAECTNVVDGDTLDVMVDLGLRTYQKHRIRLAYIDTPERGQEGWLEAKLYVEQFCLVEAEWPLTIHTVKPSDKYGRWLARVFKDKRDLGAELLETGLATPY